jgi:hypothetical protein
MQICPKVPSSFFSLFVFSLLAVLGCATDPVLEMPKPLPPIVKEYKHLSVYPDTHPIDTGIYLNKEDLFSILATGEVSFYWGKRQHKVDAISGLLSQIGDSEVFPPLSRSTGLVIKSKYEGKLYLNVYGTYRGGHFDVDIIVWEKEDYAAIIGFLENMKQKNPDDKVVGAALFQARILKERNAISKEINQIQEQIGALKKEKKAEEIASLEAKLEQLMATVEKLDDLIRKQSAEQNKSSLIHARVVEIMKEKDSLEKRLASEEDIKQQLTASLKEREAAYQKQQVLVASLYESERQLKSKLFQLEEIVRKSEEKQDELKELQIKEKSLSDQVSEATRKNEADRLRTELERVKHDKSTLEEDANHLKTIELALKNEVRTQRSLEEKARIEAENARKELAATRERERKLANQVDELKGHLKLGMAPVIVISKPKDGSKVESPTTMLHIVAVDDRGIRSVDITLNGEPLSGANDRSLSVAADPEQGILTKVDLARLLRIQYGPNNIRVSVTDTDGLTTEEEINVVREKERGKIWAVVIGINEYRNVQSLRYAISDAEGFKEYLSEYIGVPSDDIFFLTNEDATKAEIQSLLGTKIRRLAGKDDTVIIFYAGHGAVETDPVDPDGDGFEKYLLPYDANLQDLYSTSIAMKEIRTIFQRIRADRLIFLADTCYSGATGGRTMLAYKSRATLSEKFFERISKGKGRVIISACSANEVSKEDDRLQHGIFSFYLLKGLKGEADYDADGIITVNELFGFLSRKVPAASGQDQHPVKKGETEGELVIGRIK